MFRLGPVFYASDNDGQPLSLVECLHTVRGTGDAGVYRLDGTPVIAAYAGSDAGPLTYTPTGRTIHRRLTRAARRRQDAAIAQFGGYAFLNAAVAVR